MISESCTCQSSVVLSPEEGHILQKQAQYNTEAQNNEELFVTI
jgi:hypothetical protein